jgi:hypothetical protein
MTGAICNSFKRELLDGFHRPEDDYRMALYGSKSSIGSSTTIYTEDGEFQGQGYQAGGKPVELARTVLPDETACLNLASSPTWESATITARGALIYNASRDNRAVVVLDFGKDFVSVNGPFTVVASTSDEPLIRIT